jgi:glycine cleavage system H protein
MKAPAELKYTETHEWVRLEADGTATVGITDFAQEALGDIVFVEAPEVGRQLKAGEACAVVESVKAASDIYAPIAGEVVAANDELKDKPESVNADAFSAWIYRIKPANAADLGNLLDAARYTAAAEASH